jgi:hypothetical protein
MKTLLFALALVSGAASALHAQTQAARLIAAARQHIDELRTDEAMAELDSALRAGTTPAERVRAFTLLGIARLNREDRFGARLAFEQALRNDAALRVDTLAELDANLLVVFAETRTAMGISEARAIEAPPLSIALDVAADTTLAPDSARVHLVMRPSRPGEIIASIEALGTGVTVWADTQLVASGLVRDWSLRAADGSLLTGEFRLRVFARDSLQQRAADLERTIIVSRMTPDTQPVPAALGPADLLPESERLRRGAPSVLAWSFAIGAMAALGSSMMGNAELNSGQSSDATAYAVAGGITLGGIIGYLRGSRVRPLPDNAERNRLALERNQQSRAAIERANDAARERSRVRVVVQP